MLTQIQKEWSDSYVQLPPDGFLTSKYKVLINPLLADQLFVSALLDDPPLIHHKDLIRVPYRFQSVGDHDDGLVPGQFLNGLLQPVFVLRVYISGSVVLIYTTFCLKKSEMRNHPKLPHVPQYAAFPDWLQ